LNWRDSCSKIKSSVEWTGFLETLLEVIKMKMREKGGSFVLGLLALVVLLCLTATAKAQTPDTEAAKKEGKVVVYGTVPPQSMSAINKGFEEKYGIKVEYWRASSTKVMDRALTEWRAGRPSFDVVEGNRGVQLIMKKASLFAKFISPSSEKFPDQFKEKDGLITPWRFLPISILYNTELVKGSDIPKGFSDLLSPKWKGKISMPDPSQHTTTAQFLDNLDKIVGEKSKDFIKDLAKQQPHMVESLAPVANVLIRGEAQVGITYVKYIKQYKGPIDYVMIDKYLADPNYMSVSGKPANPNAARLYIEYATSPAGQKAISEEGEFVLYPGITPDIHDAQKVSSRTIFMDVPNEAEFKKLREEYRKLFFAK
jgi:iron(III) transport system substrate-binding protein